MTKVVLYDAKGTVLRFEAWNGGGGRHLNFRQTSHKFTSRFTNPPFQDLNGPHIMYWNMMILDPSRFKVEPRGGGQSYLKWIRV